MIPILTSLALVIATLSFFVASERFRLDLYNKRFDIYMRTVKFYQALMMWEEAKEDGTGPKLQADFIIACRESRFLFSPESGVSALLSQFEKDSFTLTGGLRDLSRKELLPESINNAQQISDAVTRCISSIEPLEDSMAPYLNYHSAPSGLVRRVQLWWRGVLSRGLWGNRRGGSG